jgi:mono/diheme cytochrome c family protein
MIYRFSSATALTALLTASAILSCSKAPSKADFGKGADASNSGGTRMGKDVFKEPQKLSLGALAAEDEGPKVFDFSKPFEPNWISSHEIVLAHDDGQSLAYDFDAKSWTAVHTNEVRTEFETMVDFREAGFFGAGGGALSLRGPGTKIVRLAAPESFEEKNMVGVNPGFVAYRVKDGIHAIVISGESAKLYVLNEIPKGLSLVYPCNVNCVVWGFDGSRIFVFSELEGWKALEQVIELPQGEAISRMAIRFRKENNPIAAEAIFVQTDKGSVFAQVATGAPKEETKWEDVLLLSEQYCVACHLDDGFDKQGTWTGLKSSIVDRLKRSPGTKGAMPPTETKIGQQMSPGERATILAWIEKQAQTERGQIGGDEPIDTSDISGDLKRLVDANCLSCHSDAKKTAWWSQRKADALSRIKSADMPRGKTIANDVKTQFEAALNALK